MIRLVLTASIGSARDAASVVTSQLGNAAKHAEKSPIARSTAARAAASTSAAGSIVVDGVVVSIGVVVGPGSELVVVVGGTTDVVGAGSDRGDVSDSALSPELHAAPNSTHAVRAP